MEEVVARCREQRRCGEASCSGEQRRGPSSRSPPRRLLLEPASGGEAGISSQRRHPCFSSLLPPPLFHEEDVAPQIRLARLLLELGGLELLLELALEEEVAASHLGRSPTPPASSFPPGSGRAG
nr:unnamed protein product [Digitaria exilis]